MGLSLPPLNSRFLLRHGSLVTRHLRHTNPQSNAKAENAVKTVKCIFTKCQESGQLESLTLLDWHNTPTEGVGTSPAQCQESGQLESLTLLDWHNTPTEGVGTSPAQ